MKNASLYFATTTTFLTIHLVSTTCCISEPAREAKLREEKLNRLTHWVPLWIGRPHHDDGPLRCRT
jgi:hypothetical protein